MNQLQTLMIHRFGPACLAGVSFGNWMRLLIENQFRISPRYWGKVPGLTASSLLTSAFSATESAMYNGRLRGLEVQPPVFIVGCWRSGTTYLHTLMCLDDQLASPNMFQTMYPHSFLVSESWWRPLLELATPRKRFMDNMAMNLREPHEDEMALAIMSRRSNMLSWAFPKNADLYDRYLDFSDVSAADIDVWKRAFDQFVRKVTLRTQRRLILKSPNHTARIRLLLELYPGARFLHIHRDPYDVFRSMVHMATRVTPVWGLQYFPPDEIPGMVIDTYRRLYDAFFDQVGEIPDRQFAELRYDDFVADPVTSLGKTYAELGLTGFDAARDAIASHVAARADYRRNTHREVAPEHLQLIHEHWATAFERLGYEQRAQN